MVYLYYIDIYITLNNPRALFWQQTNPIQHPKKRKKTFQLRDASGVKVRFEPAPPRFTHDVGSNPDQTNSPQSLTQTV